MLLLVLNLAGTYAFGLSGGMAGVRGRLDLFGVVVLAVVVGLAGGITRDLLIGVPPEPSATGVILPSPAAPVSSPSLPTRSSAGSGGRSTCWTRPSSRSSASLVRVRHWTTASAPHPP
jgi:Glycine transporter